MENLMVAVFDGRVPTLHNSGLQVSSKSQLTLWMENVNRVMLCTVKVHTEKCSAETVQNGV